MLCAELKFSPPETAGDPFFFTWFFVSFLTKGERMSCPDRARVTFYHQLTI